MDSFDDNPLEPCSSSKNGELEAIHDLLDEGWFFRKLLDTKAKMFRCYSDPYPNIDQKSLSANKVAGNLYRAPSLPPCIGREERFSEKGSNSGVKRLTTQLSHQLSSAQKPTKPTCMEKIEIKHIGRNIVTTKGPSSEYSLLRAPSLPACIGREEVLEEDDITMSSLIREAMPVSSDIFPPRRTSKGMTISPSMPKCRPPRSSEVENISTSIPKEQTNCPSHNQRKLKKCLSNLESKEALREFKDLRFTPHKPESKPSVVDIDTLLGFQAMKKHDQIRPKPKSWQAKSCATPIPIWSAKTSTKDVKAQLKFWARAVASNVR